MPKRKLTKPASKGTASATKVRAALNKLTKAELVDLLLELAKADRGILRQLTTQFNVVMAPDELVAATQRAIAIATDFEDRDVNCDFDYDDEAYREVKQNLGRLIDLGQWHQVMDLALELMKQGSYQVEMSDQGLMASDIEDCLSVVIGAVKRCDLPVVEILKWCATMLDNDRVGFISRNPLEALQKRLQTAAARR
jgi:uncharacterized Zn finger protein